MSISQLLDTAKALVDSGATPACQVAVGARRRALCFETFGAATNDTRFCVFSATKPIVASAVWMLIGDGLLDTGRPGRALHPRVRDERQGGRHRRAGDAAHRRASRTRRWTRSKAATPVTRVKRFTEWQLEWEPGSRFEYHALAAHWVLAELIERARAATTSATSSRHACARRNGLPRLLGLAEEEQDDIADGVPLGEPPADSTIAARRPDAVLDRPDVRAAGVPGGGGHHDRGDDGALLPSAPARPERRLGRRRARATRRPTSAARSPTRSCTSPRNRSIGLVLAGDDGLHQFRYACSARTTRRARFGHAGAFCQVAWADPASGHLVLVLEERTAG